MEENRRENKKGSLLKSFGHAFCGLFKGLGERNMKIHLAATALVLVFGFVLSISTVEWLICILCIALVISAELINTAVETVVDMIVGEERTPAAKKAKDIAAGAVLVTAIGAAAAGIVIFLPKLIGLIF